MQLLQRRCGNHSDYLIRQSNKTYTSEQTHEAEQRSAFNEHSSWLKNSVSANLFQYLLRPPYRCKAFGLTSFPNYTNSQVPLPHILLFTVEFQLIFTYLHSLLRVKTLFSDCTFWNEDAVWSAPYLCFIIKYSVHFLKWNLPLWFYGKFSNKIFFSRKYLLCILETFELLLFVSPRSGLYAWYSDLRKLLSLESKKLN